MCTKHVHIRVPKEVIIEQGQHPHPGPRNLIEEERLPNQGREKRQRRAAEERDKRAAEAAAGGANKKKKRATGGAEGAAKSTGYIHHPLKLARFLPGTKSTRPKKGTGDKPRDLQPKLDPTLPSQKHF